MPGRFNFQSPGAAATDTLVQIMAEREAKRRQDFLDSLALRRENRNDEIQHESLASLKSQREGLDEQRRQTMATNLLPMLRPGQKLDADTSGTLRQGNLGILVQKSKGQESEAALDSPTRVKVDIQGQTSPEQRNALDSALTGSVDDLQSHQTKEAMAPGEEQFAGTPDQAKAQKQREELQRFLNDPNTPPAVKQALQYEMSTGRNAPAGMFDKKDPQATTSIQEYEFDKAQRKAAGQPAISYKEYQDEDANRKAVANRNTADGYKPQQVITFNQIAGAYQRSPLMKASDRTIVLEDAVKAIKHDPANPSSQLSLAYSWVQALDTYQSAVREGELQLVGALGTRWETLKLEANKIISRGGVMPPEVAKEIAENANRLVSTINSGKKRKEREFASQAKVNGIGDMWDKYIAGFDEPVPAGPAEVAPQTRTIRNPATGETKSQTSADGGKTWK